MRKSVFILAVLTFMCSAQSGDAGLKFGGGIGADYSSGDYGGSTTVGVFRFYGDVTLQWDRLDATVTLPFISISNAGLVAFVGGRTAPVSKSPVSFRSGGASQTKSESGIGDITADVSFRVLNEADAVPAVFLVGGVKFPTADETSGLGTGKLDFTFGAGAQKNFDKFNLYAELTYTFVGEPQGLDLRDYASFFFQPGYKVTDSVNVFGEILWQGSAARGQDGMFMVGGGVEVDVTSSIKIRGNVLAGLTNGSPDFFGGASVGVMF